MTQYNRLLHQRPYYILHLNRCRCSGRSDANYTKRVRPVTDWIFHRIIAHSNPQESFVYCTLLFEIVSRGISPECKQNYTAQQDCASTSSSCSLPKRESGSETLHTAARVKPRVSACKPLCAILLRKASVYPLSPAKANVGHLCEKLKSGMKSGWGQRCDGNFLAIFAETVLSVKPNFTGRFFER